MVVSPHLPQCPLACQGWLPGTRRGCREVRDPSRPRPVAQSSAAIGARADGACRGRAPSSLRQRSGRVARLQVARRRWCHRQRGRWKCGGWYRSPRIRSASSLILRRPNALLNTIKHMCGRYAIATSRLPRIENALGIELPGRSASIQRRADPDGSHRPRDRGPPLRTGRGALGPDSGLVQGAAHGVCDVQRARRDRRD